MNIRKIFETFSKREVVSKKLEIPDDFRNRTIMLCIKAFGSDRLSQYSIASNDFWEDMHEKLRYRHGKFKLSAHSDNESKMDDVCFFLTECSAEFFLDFIEDIFLSNHLFRSSIQPAEIVDGINTFFENSRLPLYLTEFVTREVKRPVSDLGGRVRTVIETVSYPRVILKENSIQFSASLKPAMVLLQNPVFKNANDEFMASLEDQRKGDYRDCLTKCGSSLESVLKIVCKERKWKYKETDTASTLMDIFFNNSKLDKFYEQPLLLIATIRNKYSMAHGAGSTTKEVEPHVAQYMINATAAAISLITREAGL